MKRVLFSSLLAVGVLSPMGTFGQTREEAVTMARAGQTEQAIAALRKLLAETPTDPLVAFDLAVILTWVNRPQEATEAFERARTAEPPEHVLGPVIRAYRDQKRFKEAERWAREAGRRYPLEVTWGNDAGVIIFKDTNGTVRACAWDSS